MKNENKTRVNDASVDAFLETVDPTKQDDSRELIALMQEVSGEPAKMWGQSIIGFGSYHYRYPSGREGDWMRIGFSPRKASFSLYISCDASEFDDELARLGKTTHGRGCIYFKQLDDIDTDVLREMLEKAYTSDSYGQ